MVLFKSLFVSTYPGYLKELFVFRNSSYSLRGKNILTLPIPRRSNYGLECIRYQAAKIQNSLPDSMRIMTSIKDVKKAIKETNFQSQFQLLYCSSFNYNLTDFCIFLSRRYQLNRATLIIRVEIKCMYVCMYEFQ